MVRETQIHRRRYPFRAVRLGVLCLSLAACQSGPAASTATPAPSASAAAASQGTQSRAEAHLLFGIRTDVTGTCVPDRTDLPARAIGAIECHPDSDLVEGLNLYLFENQDGLEGAYLAEIAKNGLVLRSNSPDGRSGEGAWIPGDGITGQLAPERQAWFVDRSGKAGYIGTLPPFVLVTADGRNGDAAELLRWPWRGNQDQPGAPTIWRSSGPMSPEK